MSKLESWASEVPNDFDEVAPIGARTCGALYAMLRRKPRRPGHELRLMAKGAERC